MYSSNEIEKKRLMALKIRQDRMQKNSSTSRAPPKINDQSQESNTIWKRPNESNAINSPVLPIKKAKFAKAIEPVNFFGQTNVIKGTYRMITPSRFEVDVPYHQPLIEFFKKFSTKSYDQKTKLWSFDIKEYENFKLELKSKLPQVQLVGIPKFVIQTFLNIKPNSNTNEMLDFSRIDKKLWNCLMPFQKEGVAFGIQKNGRCIIADDMGLGKTIQALGIAHYYKDDWPLLIVTPSSVRFQWSDVIFEYLPSVPTQHVHQFSNSKDTLGSEKITITSYDLLARSIEMFKKKKFGTIILDESHLLKNHKTERTKAVQTLANDASRIILLSGTPALSRPIELYSQLQLIMSSFMRLQEYGMRYCNAKKTTYGWDYSGASNVTELQLLLRARCLLRRLKTDVLKQLPSKIRQVVLLDPSLIDTGSKEVMRITKKLQEHSVKGVESHSTMLQLYNASSTQRLRAVRNYVKDLLENDNKFLIFAHHQCVLTTICEVLDGKKVQYIKIDGKTGPEKRKQYVDQFQNSEECKVAVLSITAANAGITLTAAHFVVFAELYWNPGILVQAEDRVHRIGQNSGVFIQYLVAKKTVDDFLWPLLQTKLKFLTNAGLNQDFSLNDVEISNQNIIKDEQESSDYKKTQTKMDSFVNINNSSISQVSNNLNNLLDENEDDFANIDLDSIMLHE
ncbi:hypothetical protein PV327_005100 [Microctonus hyperodae]|uniref:SWI/SNF-related matrix-associated actin-dependent regulator of chromatin subfamily A-like protein 1 n=1 Tax=Microctonus hyperodae TaxID=165561 RepID=A0AA39G0P6_MICHY|nr:hypothetical protein PV327_005100 [Microctonus hyperodae]